MSKYIAVDRLKAKLDEHYRKYQSKYMETRAPYTQGLIDALDLAEQVIDSLQQEQPEVVKGWVARNRPNVSPSLMFFYDKPIRQDNGWGDKFWHSPNAWSKEISIPANLFPSLQWKDEPIEVELVIRNARKED